MPIAPLDKRNLPEIMAQGQMFNGVSPVENGLSWLMAKMNEADPLGVGTPGVLTAMPIMGMAKVNPYLQWKQHQQAIKEFLSKPVSYQFEHGDDYHRAKLLAEQLVTAGGFKEVGGRANPDFRTISIYLKHPDTGKQIRISDHPATTFRSMDFGGESVLTGKVGKNIEEVLSAILKK